MTATPVRYAFETSMQLTLYTDYALRTLIYVASHPGEPISSARIAEAFEISPDHVAKAAKSLTRAGYLRAKRGAHGGVELAQAACDIRIGEVARLFEGPAGVLECIRTPPGNCKISPACRLKRVLKRAEEAFFAELDQVTLADMLENRPQLVRLLSPQARTATAPSKLKSKT